MTRGGIVESQRLKRMMDYLDQDPFNLNLLRDSCLAAVEAGNLDMALGILDRYEAIEPLSSSLLNFKGLIAIWQDRFEEAEDIFKELMKADPDEPTLRFNLAWAKSMLGKNDEAIGLIDEQTWVTVPGAAALKVRALHLLGDLEGALNCSEDLTEDNFDDENLMGALSVVAIDAMRIDKAREWGLRAQGTAEGLSALGILCFYDQRLDEAAEYFDRGLALRADSARNLLGKGLVLLAAGDVAAAVKQIDQAAHLFGTHLGTWIASGWAHFANGNQVVARQIFEHALALDDTFSESHGALAVLDILSGDIISARRRADIALRLDQRSLAGILAKSMLLDRDGDPQAAERIRALALNTPLGSGRTIAQSLTVMSPFWGLRRRS